MYHNSCHNTTCSHANLHSQRSQLSHCTAYLFCCKRTVASGGASVLRSPHIIADGKPNANHFVDLRRVGGPTHKCNEMALRLKTSRHLMHCFPMLLVCPFIGKPTRFDRAQRAFHHRDEAQPHLLLLIASSPVRHQPFFSWCLHV